jgi:hypothetical protein
MAFYFLKENPPSLLYVPAIWMGLVWSRDGFMTPWPSQWV